jgi:phage major head subunit gpT-like protein
MKLNNVTIAAVAGTKAIETLKAIKYSMKELEFDRAILITPDNIYDDQVEIIKCDTLN